MLVDACVWLDLARDPCAPALIGALEELIGGGHITLVVAPAIIEEFAQNRAWLLEEGGQSISRTRRRVEAKRGRSPRKARTVADELNAIDLELVNLGDRAADTVARIETLLAGGELHAPTDAIKARAAERGVLRKAPFHRPRNGTNDAILVEIYANMVARKGGGRRFAFVTHNTKDFSHPTINQKAAHPDLAALFATDASRYFVTLGEALRSVRPDELIDLVIEEEWSDQPRRKIAEIVAAEHELFEKVWYNHQRLRQEKVASGQLEIVEQEPAGGRSIRRETWEGALRAARQIEDRYGLENLGPWNELEWGMINGKLSALGWALGDEWDMLT